MNPVAILCLIALFYWLITLTYERVSDDAVSKRWKHLKFERFLSILVHLTNCLIVYYAFGRSQTSFMAAMLFMVHPVNSQSVVWMSGRVYAQTAMFGLLMFLFNPTFPWVVPIIYAITIFYTPSALLAPLLLISENLYLLTIIPVGIYFFFSRANLLKRIKDAGKVEYGKLGERFVIMLKTFGYYFSLCAFPVNLGMYHTFLCSYGQSKKQNKKWTHTNLDLIILPVLIYALIVYPKNSFGLIWFIVLMLPYCNLIPLQQPIAERYCYLPIAGLCLFIANVAPPIIFWCVFTYYATKLIDYLPAYRNIDSYVEYNFRNFPRSQKALFEMGVRAALRQEAVRALRFYNAVIHLYPDNYDAYFNLAVLLAKSGNKEAALDYFNKSAERAKVLIPNEKLRKEFLEGIEHNRQVLTKNERKQ